MSGAWEENKHPRAADGKFGEGGGGGGDKSAAAARVIKAAAAKRGAADGSAKSAGSGAHELTEHDHARIERARSNAHEGADIDKMFGRIPEGTDLETHAREIGEKAAASERDAIHNEKKMVAAGHLAPLDRTKLDAVRKSSEELGAHVEKIGDDIADKRAAAMAAIHKANSLVFEGDENGEGKPIGEHHGFAGDIADDGLNVIEDRIGKSRKPDPELTDHVKPDRLDDLHANLVKYDPEEYPERTDDEHKAAAKEHKEEGAEFAKVHAERTKAYKAAAEDAQSKLEALHAAQVTGADKLREVVKNHDAMVKAAREELENHPNHGAGDKMESDHPDESNVYDAAESMMRAASDELDALKSGEDIGDIRAALKDDARDTAARIKDFAKQTKRKPVITKAAVSKAKTKTAPKAAAKAKSKSDDDDDEDEGDDDE